MSADTYTEKDFKVKAKPSGNHVNSKHMWLKASLPLSPFDTDVKNALLNCVDEKIKMNFRSDF